MATTKAELPQNIFSSASPWRENIRDKAVESIKTAFPFTGKKYTVQVENVRVKPAEYGPTDFKKAMMTARTLSEPIKGTLVLKDAGGKTLQKVPDFTLAQLPYYTPHHTFLIEGTPHAVNSQLRMKPGVYTRKKRNEELEAQFNTIGNPFRMTMDPESGHFHVEYQTSRIPLYPILNKLGVSDKEISAHWNPQLVEANRNKFSKIDQHFDKLYSKIVRPSEESTDKVEAVNKAFARTQLDPDVTKELLGKSFTHVTPGALLAASQKLLRAYNDKQDFDERDNLAYKRIMGVDDFIAERIKLDARDLKRKVMLKLDYGQPDLEKAIPTSPFTRGIRKFLSTSALSGSPTQINPLELMDAATKVTSMGEGGISSDRAVPTEARHLHGSHLGVLDPVRTPESYRAGIELRTALFTSRDKQGNIFTALTDRAGKTRYVPVSEASKKAIAFPGQDMHGRIKVDVLQAGKLRSIPASQVDYMVPNVHGMYTVSTNLIPFLNSIDGNRAEMGSKMVTQALPLKDPEPPLVQVASYRPGLSMEEEIARKVVPTAKTRGVVDKIKDGFIYIKSKDAKTAAVERVPFFENYPLATKTYLHDTLKVKVGDEVKPGQALADSIFVRDGQLALGKNLRVAYAPFRGMNTNDAIVVSDSASKKLTSLHMYREGLDVERDMRTGRDVHKSYFGNKFTADHYKTLDDDGLIKPGTKVTPGDPLIVAVRKSPLSADAKMLGKLHKSLVNPYRDASVLWEHDTPGVVTDVAKTGNKIRLTVKTEEPLRIGDKLCFPEDIEVLTRDGWKSSADVTLNDVCYTRTANGCIELHEPTELHQYPVAGELYELHSQQVDLRVTISHRLLVKLRNKSEFELLPANEVIGKRVRHKKNAEWVAPTPDSFPLPVFEYPKEGKGCTQQKQAALRFNAVATRAWLQFLGIYLANGNSTVYERTDRPGETIYRVQVSSTLGIVHSVSGDQHGWIRTVLDECGFPYTERDDRFYIHSKQLVLYLKRFGYAHEKNIPREVFSWGKDAAEWLLNGLIGCDGHKTKSNSFGYTTVSKQLADDIQQLALHAGYAANITVALPTNPAWHPRYNVKFVHAKCEPQVNHGHTRTQHGQREHLVLSDEPVWGITVPNNTLYVRVNGKPVWTGNSNRYGAKGVVSMIVPDDQMLQDTDGKPIDVAMTPAGVISRLNPAQILEAAIAKVAQKTGKSIHIENFAHRDNLQWVKDQLEKHGLSDTETLIDPATGKKLKNVLVGPQYTYKLMKTTETNFSARGIGDGDYDVNQQPSTGGPTGSKGMGRLEFNALVAHDARNILKEIATLKSQRNDEWWRAHQLGLPAPAIKTSFAYDKFGAMLAGAGVKMNKEGNHISLGPLTDKDVTKMSAGAIKRPLFVKAKDLSPERGGFFDPVVTGGLNGTKWSHVDLIEPVVNPVFERPVKTFLGMTQTEFEKTLKAEGGGGIKNRLSKIDMGQREKNVMAELTAARADKRDNLVKELKYLRALNSVGMRPEDAYITSKIPVPPPIYRPIVPGKTGDLQISDANSLLRDAMIANDLLSKTRGLPGVQEDARKHLYDSMGALYGLHDPVSPQLLARNAQGYIARIAGVGSPKSGFFQSKLVKRQQDISGRGTIVPDSTLAMDEVGLPEDAGWAMFAPFVIKSLVQRGYGALDAKKMVEDRHPVAKETLLAETRNRPVLVNRAPSLYRYNVLAAYPKLVPGKTIRVPEALAPIQSGDYDGDAVTIMAPVTAAAVEEARGLTLPNMLLSDQRKFTLTKAAPQQESVLGLYKATSGKASGKAQTFETKGDALEAYHRGEISLNTPVTIKRHTTKLSSELGILNWCGRNEDV